tara:strand:- start:8377 stop:8709 length:333 start_codon:yes stop_codon:yes gene_type:complete
MAINYKWVISQMDAYVESQGQSNVIHKVQWTYLGQEETYMSVLNGEENYTYTAGDPFIPYENTKAFEDVVVSWLNESLDVSDMQSIISADIQLQKFPENEELYFTWQDSI